MLIEVQNLTKKYGTHTAIDGISFSVNHDEHYDRIHSGDKRLCQNKRL